MEIQKAQGFLELFNEFDLSGENVEVYYKGISELAQAYEDTQAATKMDDIEAYHVASMRLENAGKETLLFGVTYLQPVTVNDECCLTRGHFHQDREYGEVYVGLTGHGYLIKWDGVDEIIIENVVPGSVHIIDGKYAHRLVNIAKEETAVGAVWSPNAGHNYEEIEKTGFPIRVFNKNGKIEIHDTESRG